MAGIPVGASVYSKRSEDEINIRDESVSATPHIVKLDSWPEDPDTLYRESISCEKEDGLF